MSVAITQAPIESLRCGYKRTEAGVIPEDWKVRRLQDVTSKIVDGVHHKPNYTTNGVPFLTVRNLTAGPGINLGNCSFISYADHKQFVKRADPRAGDVLVTKDGTLGVSRIVPLGLPEVSIFVSVALLRPIRSEITPEFIHYFFDSGEHESQLGALSAGTGLQHIHLAHFQDFRLRIPPLPEQRAIAEALGNVDALIATQQKLIAKKRAIKTGTMQRLLTGKQRLPGFGEGCGYKQTEIGLIPEDWKLSTLGPLTFKVGSGITPTGGARVYFTSGRPFLRSQNIGWGNLRLADLAYIVMLNITGASIGRVAVATAEIAGGNVNQHVCLIRTDNRLLNSDFLARVLLSDRGQRQIDSFQAGGNRQGLNFGQIRGFTLLLSPLQEQKATFLKSSPTWTPKSLLSRNAWPRPRTSSRA